MSNRATQRQPTLFALLSASVEDMARRLVMVEAELAEMRGDVGAIDRAMAKLAKPGSAK
jgi:hypothetical protein